MNKFVKLKDISEGKALNIIQKPILTEKSTNLNQFNQYTFKVNLKSNSLELLVIKSLYPSDVSFRTMAEPTIPLCPAIYILSVLFIFGFFKELYSFLKWFFNSNKHWFI